MLGLFHKTRQRSVHFWLWPWRHLFHSNLYFVLGSNQTDPHIIIIKMMESMTNYILLFFPGIKGLFWIWLCKSVQDSSAWHSSTGINQILNLNLKFKQQKEFNRLCVPLIDHLLRLPQKKTCSCHWHSQGQSGTKYQHKTNSRQGGITRFWSQEGGKGEYLNLASCGLQCPPSTLHQDCDRGRWSRSI